MPKNSPRTSRNSSSGAKWYLRAYAFSARLLATLAVLLMVFLFFQQIVHIGQQSFNDTVALCLIPILLSICYLCSWKSLWWSGAAALLVLVAFLAFMINQNLGETLPIEIILLLNLPTFFLISGAALIHFSGRD
ncbi:hypothetical protein IKZ80_00395 [bacterium]|nr:hypothetical protein [bacterium]